MAITPVKALLFLLGGTAAAGATAYIAGALDPWLQGDRPAAIAALPDAPPVDADKKDDRLPDAPAPIAATPPAGETPPADAAAPAVPPTGPIAPSFDLVRLEADGSLVIAGKAEGNAKVEVLSGETVLGGTTAGSDGDFAIVLDNPLKPGDYQLSLRATPPGGAPVMSVATAVVSVPDLPNGEVLAMVEEPGKPTEVITKPEAPADAAAVAPAPETPPAGQDVAATPPAPDSPAAGTDVAAMPPAAEAPAPDAPAAGTDVAAAPPATETPAPDAPAAGTDVAAAPPAADAPAAPPAGQEIAAVSPEPAPAEQPTQPVAPAARVAVEAVEIEGRMIFVAGAADPGRRLRGYANEILLGDTMASPEGRFLIEAERDLPVGEYIIRIDALGDDGGTVVARAAVPFQREPGDIAAVAPPAGETPPAAVETPPAVAEAPAAPAETPPAVVEAPAAPVETPPAVAEAPATETPPPAVAEAPATEAPPAVAEAPAVETPAPSEPAPPAVAEAPATEPAPAEATPPAVAAAPAAPAEAPPAVAEAPAAEMPAPAEATPPPAVAAAPAEPPAAPAEAPPAVAEAPVEAPPAAEAPVEAPITIAEAPADPAPPPATDVPATLAPKLQPSATGVIIRRGDTLWRISRRVYGKGIRYSTIYLANQTQIEDPDRIWPGQVFKMPEKSDDGISADWTSMGKQKTTVE